MSLKKKYMDMALSEVYKRHIAIKDEEYKKQQTVFLETFKQVKKKMEDQCQYFKNYSSQVMYAGSVYDGLKVSQLDEFDMDIVIRLPINYEDGDDGIIVENGEPGFVKLKIKNGFDFLDKKPNWEKCHVVIRDWRDDKKYFLQNKFRAWLHSIVQKAVNDLQHKVTVNGVNYKITYQQSGPAFTLKIRNDTGNEYFLLDVDLVPVIRFTTPRWLPDYRSPEGLGAKEWYVVPKPNKSIEDETLQNRCWRLSFQDFERDLMKESDQLKITIRLVKKLRDSLQMKCIASYYIKTLFLWKQDEVKDKTYWRKGISTHFREMVEVLYKAINKKNIPYFWHKENNLIAGMKSTIAELYSRKLQDVLKHFDDNNIEKVISLLLPPNEMTEFKKSNFYVAHYAHFRIVGLPLSRSPSPSSNMTDDIRKSFEDLVKPMQAEIDSLKDEVGCLKKQVASQRDDEHSYRAKFFEVGEALAEALDPLDLGTETTKRLKTNNGERKSALDSDIEILSFKKGNGRSNARRDKSAFN